MKNRIWCFTDFNMDMDWSAVAENEKIKYICVGKELCPDTKKQHWQGFVYFFNQVASLKNVKKLSPTAHWEMGKGTFAQNFDYCSKDGDFSEYGEKPLIQGQRKDLERLKENILEGTCVDEIACEFPHLFHQYGRTLDRLERIALRKKYRTWMTKGIWIHGNSGVGKSKKVFDDFNPDTHYVKCLNDEWWDGYTGQEIVILNEFRGNIALGELFDLVDRYPKTVKQRNKEPIPFLAKTLYITSNKDPYQTYEVLGKEENSEQFERRFETIHMK